MAEFSVKLKSPFWETNESDELLRRHQQDVMFREDVDTIAESLADWYGGSEVEWLSAALRVAWESPELDWETRRGVA